MAMMGTTNALGAGAAHVVKLPIPLALMSGRAGVACVLAEDGRRKRRNGGVPRASSRPDGSIIDINNTEVHK